MRSIAQNTKKEILRKVKAGHLQKDIAKQYGINKNTLSRWVQVERQAQKETAPTKEKLIEAYKTIANRLQNEASEMKPYDIKKLTTSLTKLHYIINS